MSAPNYETLKLFFEMNELCIRAAESLKNGSEIGLEVANEPYTFTKQSGKNQFILGKPKKPDMSFIMTGLAAQGLVEKKFASVGEVGIYIFQHVASQKAEEKIHVKFHTGFLGLMTSGYFGILTAGGADVAKYLASRGFTNFNKLRDVISKLKE